MTGCITCIWGWGVTFLRVPFGYSCPKKFGESYETGMPPSTLSTWKCIAIVLTTGFLDRFVNEFGYPQILVFDYLIPKGFLNIINDNVHKLVYIMMGI